MKQLSRPISSPCQAKKYPPRPQLMSFLNCNGGSRSRGRSRSSPMFTRKKNASIETQEPSSPKVTCMGQVRVKRSKQIGSKPGLCKWIKNALFCYNFHGKVKAMLRFFGSCRKPKAREDSSKLGNKTEESEEEAENFASSYCSSPPKNALILTRCRSAPYRSSSLACRFWESPVANYETNEETEIEKRVFKEETEVDNRVFKKETEVENRVFKDEVNPTTKTESITRNLDHGSRIDIETEENANFCKEFEDEKFEKTENCEELKTEQQGNVRPPVLTRCKSEPANTGARLDPEISF